MTCATLSIKPNQRPTKHRRKPKLSSTSCRPLSGSGWPPYPSGSSDDDSNVPTVDYSPDTTESTTTSTRLRPVLLNLQLPITYLYMLSSPFEQTFGLSSQSQYGFSAPSSIKCSCGCNWFRSCTCLDPIKSSPPTNQLVQHAIHFLRR